MDESEWSASRFGLFTPGEKPPVPLNGRQGGPQSRSGRGGKEKNSLSLPGIESRSSSLWCSHYTDWAILVTINAGCRWAARSSGNHGYCGVLGQKPGVHIVRAEKEDCVMSWYDTAIMGLLPDVWVALMSVQGGRGEVPSERQIQTSSGNLQDPVQQRNISIQN
jgi:hypothetical protein